MSTLSADWVNLRRTIVTSGVCLFGLFSYPVPLAVCNLASTICKRARCHKSPGITFTGSEVIFVFDHYNVMNTFALDLKMSTQFLFPVSLLLCQINFFSLQKSRGFRKLLIFELWNSTFQSWARSRHLFPQKLYTSAFPFEFRIFRKIQVVFT